MSSRRTFIRNFDYEEFDCPRSKGSGQRHMDRELLLMLDEAQNKYPHKMKIVRGYVTPQYAREISIPTHSPHMLGKAVCIFAKHPKRRFFLIAALLEVGFTRFLVGPDYVYVDNDELKPTMFIAVSREPKLNYSILDGYDE